MATAEEVALLRKLVGDTAAPQRFTDAELDAALDAAPSCPLARDEYGFPVAGVTPAADTYGVAATLWDDRALEADTAGEDGAPVRITSERNGDVAVTYAGAGKAVGATALTARGMRAIAARLRKRSCNYTGGARTVAVQAPNGTLETPARGGLYPSQLVN